jgi:flagellar basal-body rod modification protein FlgD
MSTTTATSASDLQMDYMNLLVTQLKNQNPLEPMDNSDMAAQLAQYSQLEQLETMNGSFSKVLSSVQQSQASLMIGKTVSFTYAGEDGTEQTAEGTVSKVILNEDGDTQLQVGTQTVSLSDVTSVQE